MRTILVISSAALALAACQKSPAASGSATETATAPAATPLGGQPVRRPGLWQTSFSRDGKASPMGSMKMCVDKAMEAKASVFSHGGPRSMGDSHCSYPAPTRGLDGSYSFTSTCPLAAGGQTLTKGTARGDWSSDYRIHIENDTTGASEAQLNGHHVMEVESKWLGPCPAGMVGGDVQLANGMSIRGGKLAGAAAMLRGATGRGTPAGQ
ncbi:MAG: DUF3617 domain-containing protein [Caulobacteraceae bacterium]